MTVSDEMSSESMSSYNLSSFFLGKGEGGCGTTVVLGSPLSFSSIWIIMSTWAGSRDCDAP